MPSSQRDDNVENDDNVVPEVRVVEDVRPTLSLSRCGLFGRRGQKIQSSNNRSSSGIHNNTNAAGKKRKKPVALPRISSQPTKHDDKSTKDINKRRQASIPNDFPKEYGFTTYRSWKSSKQSKVIEIPNFDHDRRRRRLSSTSLPTTITTASAGKNRKALTTTTSSKKYAKLKRMEREFLGEDVSTCSSSRSSSDDDNDEEQEIGFDKIKSKRAKTPATATNSQQQQSQTRSKPPIPSFYYGDDAFSSSDDDDDDAEKAAELDRLLQPSGLTSSQVEKTTQAHEITEDCQAVDDGTRQRRTLSQTSASRGEVDKAVACSNESKSKCLQQPVEVITIDCDETNDEEFEYNNPNPMTIQEKGVQKKELNEAKTDEEETFLHQESTSPNGGTFTNSATDIVASTSPRKGQHIDDKKRKQNIPSRTLEELIDYLFLQSDLVQVTVKKFIKSLEGTLGVTLEKGTRSLVKTRLQDLVDGNITPIASPSEETIAKYLSTTKCERSSKETANTKITKDSVNVESTGRGVSNPLSSETLAKLPTKAILQVEDNRRVSSSQELSRLQQKAAIESSKRSTSKQEATNAAHGGRNLDTVKPSPNEVAIGPSKNRSEESEASFKLERHVTIEEQDVSAVSETQTKSTIPKKEPAKTRKSSSGKKSEREKIDSESKIVTAPKKRRGRPKSKKEVSKVDSDDELCEILEIPKDNLDQIIKKVQTQRKRGRPAKAAAGGDTELETKQLIGAAKATTTTTTTTKKRAPPRKRARKAKCDICAKCPCQNMRFDAWTSTTLSLGQNDVALEKARIGIVQELEKYSERVEIKTDIEKRKLKRHRREMWKKYKQEQTEEADQLNTENGHAKKSRFLPDVEEFEAHNPNGRVLRQDQVEKAQLALFNHISDPNSGEQVTLTQILGLRSDKRKAKTDDADISDQDDSSSQDSEPPVEEDDDASSLGDEIEQYIVGPEPVDCVHRVEWRNNSRYCPPSSQILLGPSAWGALTSIAEEGEYDESSASAHEKRSSGILKSFKCPFDRLFTDDRQNNGPDGPNDVQCGMNELVQLLDDLGGAPSTQVPDGVETDSDTASVVSISMLSQGGQDLAREVEAEICSRVDKVSALQTACPNWKENIAFALHQRDEYDVHEALESVRMKRKKMAEIKEKILEAWERQNLALDVFETALSKSLTKLSNAKTERPEESAKSKPQNEIVDGGFLTGLSPATQDGDCEDTDLVENQMSQLDPVASMAAALSPTNVELSMTTMLARRMQVTISS